ncbi:LamG domain-containing protein [Vitiosangium sp. GDMCC 1.1324]|uniref:LamG domain-containing protein n=1 Tax=Vitiosangium sp. (strain GDMCC 1.1324) TaxID=2138576 RepID=UPI00130EF6C5|nr:LamG domain-containing protein [Vitiosangium sp. GDMCC 1.1324]
MVRSFAITTSTPVLRLDGSGKGEVTFTVTNALGRPVRARALLEPEGNARGEWLTLVGEPERDFAPDGTHQYTVRVDIPPGTPEGTYAFRLSSVSVENPDEDFAVGPSVGFQVSRPVVPVRPKQFPWWVVALASGLFLIVLVSFLVARAHREGGTGGSGSADTHVFLRFDGTGVFVDLGNPRSLNIEGPVTLEAWIRPQALDSLRDVVAHGYSIDPAREVVLRISDGTYQAGSWDGLEHFAGAPAPGSDVGQWVHLAGVFDGTQWLLYRNGELLASSGPQAPDSVRASAAPWAIGAKGGGIERAFLGDIRDVRVWNVARSQEEIRTDMTRAPKKDAPGLMGYWPIDEGQGNIVRDVSTQQNHGVIRGAEWGGPAKKR